METLDLPNLDLAPVRYNLVVGAHGPHWTEEQAELVERWYLRFLWLCREYPDVALVPSRLIDEFWHQHILDTRKYAADCQAYFGYFLHHFPYFGARGTDDVAKWEDATSETRRLFLQVFGEDYSTLHALFQGGIASHALCSKGCRDIKGALELTEEVRPRL